MFRGDGSGECGGVSRKNGGDEREDTAGVGGVEGAAESERGVAKSESGS